jgi:hypothetical protein
MGRTRHAWWSTKYMQIFGREREEKVPLKDPRRRTGNNTDMGLTEIRENGGD